MKTAIQKLCSGGKKKKRKFQSGGTSGSTNFSSILQNNSSEISDLGNDVTNSILKSFEKKIDYRENPYKKMRKNMVFERTADILAKTTSGFFGGMGSGSNNSTLPLAGANAGAGNTNNNNNNTLVSPVAVNMALKNSKSGGKVNFMSGGLASSLAGGALGTLSGVVDLIGGNDESRIKDYTNQWSNNWQSLYADAYKNQGYKKGGLKGISPEKAKEMIKNPPHGKPLSKEQLLAFQAIVHGWHPKYKSGGEVDIIKNGNPQDFIRRLMDPNLKWKDDLTQEYRKGGIHIKPENRGKFTAYKKRTGKTTAEALQSKDPHVRQMANFARMAKRKFKKLELGGLVLSTGRGKSKGLAEGGKIKGPGTPKSDSIKMKAEDGSFIVPAEHASEALELGRRYLGWEEDQTAKREYASGGIKVSDDEVFFTPEEVSILSYNGINLDALAPNAESNQNYSKGGYIWNEAKGTYVWDENATGDDPDYADWKAEQQKKTTTKETSTINPEKITGKEKRYQKFQDEYIKTKPNAKPDEIQREFQKEEKKRIENIKTTASTVGLALPGVIQTILGAKAMNEAGKMPDINIAHALDTVINTQRKLAEYGLEPGMKSSMLSDAERARRDVMNMMVRRGGSASEMMEGSQRLLSEIIANKNKINITDISERVRKRSELTQSLLAKAGQEYDIQKLNLDNWFKLQDANSELLRAGLSNMVGSLKFNMQRKTLKEIGTSAPDINLTT